MIIGATMKSSSAEIPRARSVRSVGAEYIYPAADTKDIRYSSARPWVLALFISTGMWAVIGWLVWHIISRS
jgi:hypothetical protein